MENMTGILNVASMESGILHLSLNRPEQHNALSQALLQKLSETLTDVKQDSSIKAILLTGEGKGFCAGADIKQLAGLNGAKGLAFATFGQAVFNQLSNLGKPSLAAIQGFAFGGGCELAMAATLRLAADDAVLGQPEIKLGVMPGFGGTQRLARLIGKGRALEVCLTGRRVSALEALHWGLLNEVTSPDALIPRAKALLQALTQLGAVALQSIMTTIEQGYDQDLTSALALEAAAFGVCCTTSDKQEGVNAFIEKRAAVFNGE